MPGLYDMLASIFRPPEQPNPYGMLAGALSADPDGAGGFADIAGNSREARAAAGVVTAPVQALDYFGKTLRGEAPLYDLNTGHPSDEAYGAAGTLAGVGMTGGIGAPVRTAAGEVALGAGPIRAYHGSPHDFERFDLSKIGTGEGAQAYGHGLYFAENEGVARSYRDALSSTPQSIVNRYTKKYSGRLDSAIRDLEDSAKAYRMVPEGHPFRTQRLPDVENDLKILQDYRAFGPSAGRMYEVGIHADPQRFLDWDKPMTAQSTPVQKTLQDLLPLTKLRPDKPARLDPGLRGETAYRQLGRWASDNPQAFPDLRGYTQSPSVLAADRLREAGIPGIQYLDQGSRGAPGGGTLNRVVFDDRLVEILRKYGLLGPLIAGAATASMPEAARK